MKLPARFLGCLLFLACAGSLQAATPAATNVTSTLADGSYTISKTVPITVNFSSAVIVSGTPQLQLNSGASVFANYSSGSGSRNLVFNYIVGAGDTSVDLDYTSTTALTLNGGAITNSSGVAATLTLTSPGTTASLGANKNIVIDTTAPTLSSVTGPAAKSYNAGANLDFTVTFSENVTVTGTPRIPLTIGTASAFANYQSGSGTTTIVFRYKVLAGDNGVLASSSPIDTNGGSLADAAGNSAALSFTPPDTSGVIVDTTAPTISSVTGPANGSYKAGAAISFNVNFSENVTVKTQNGTPTLPITVGGVTQNASYASGSGSSTLIFTYTLQAGDTGVLASSSPIVTNGGTIRDSAGNDATLTFTPPDTSAVFADTTAPTISSVTAPNAGSYKAGANLNFSVAFSETVNVTGTPKISITVGGAAQTANYQSGSGSSSLTFRYTVQAGDAGVLVSTSPIASGTIKDVAGNSATLTFTPPDTSAVFADTTAPTISSVTGPASGSYRAGQGLSFTVNFSESVTVKTQNGTPTLPITVGGVAQNASYASGSGSSALTFTYTVQAGDTGLLASSSPIVTNGGTMRDGAGNDATLTFTPPDTSAVFADTTAPTIISLTGPASGNYRAGQSLDFTVTFSEVVTQGSNPKLPITIGGASHSASYSSGSGTSVLVFSYTIQSGDNGVLASSSPIGSGTVKDAAGNNAVLTFTPPDTSGVQVDTVAPTISSVTGPGSGNYKSGANLDFTVTFSENVNVTGTPKLPITIGGSAHNAAYLSGSGSTVLVFEYQVQAGDNGTLASASPIASGTIKDAAGNSAVLTFTPPDTSGVNIDTTAPTVSSVSGPESGYYRAGQNLDFTVTFSENVVVTGTPRINLTVGTASVTADYLSGSGSSTWVFRYVVQAGDTDNDGIVCASNISLNGGTLKDAAGNNAVRTFTAPDTSLVFVDTSAPMIDISDPSVPRTTSGPVTYVITYSDLNLDPITLNIEDVTLNTTGAATGTITDVSGTNDTYVVTVSNLSGDGNVSISIAAGTADDTAGNLAPAAGPSNTFSVDNTPPQINISSPSVAATRTGPITYTVTYSDANFNSSTLAVGDIVLNTSGTANGNVASVTGTGNTRLVTINNISGDGNLSISINAGTATDLLGFVADAAGPGPSVTVDNTAPVVNISSPSSSLTKSGPVTFTVTYVDVNFSASTLKTTDITLNKTGTANGSISSVTGTGNTRLVTVSSVTGDGTLSISVPSGTGTDTAGNDALAAGPSTVFSVDNTPPGIVVGLPSVAATRNGPVTFSVTYFDLNFQSSSLTLENLSLNTSGTATGTISGLTGSGTSYTVTVSNLSGDGNLSLVIVAGTAVDAVGNTAPAVAAGPNLIVDNTAPVAPAITGISPDTGVSSSDGVTSSRKIHILGTAETNSTVTVSRSDLGVLGTTTANSVGSWNYDYTGTSLADGSYTFTATATDAAGNTSGNSASYTAQVDNTPPSVNISAPSVPLTENGPVTFTVTYSDPNFNSSTLSVTDISLNTTGSADASVNSVTGHGNTRLVTISSISGDGTISISISPGTATDTVGNQAGSAGPSTSFTVDNTPPAVKIGSPSVTITNSSGSVSYAVTYTDANFNQSTLSVGDITVNKTGTANGSVASVAGTGNTRTVTLSNLSGDGTLGISIAANTATDLLGQNAGAAGPSATFKVDNTAPTVQISAPSTTVTKNGPVTYTITYSDVNFNASTLSPSDVSLNKTGTATGEITSVTGTGNTRTVTVSNISGDGTLGIKLASGTASDLAGNSAPASNNSTTFKVDNTAPAISIGAPSTAYTRSGPVTYVVTYSDANFSSSSLSTSDITLIRTGTANGTVSAVSGSGNTRNVTLSNLSGDGTLSISIGAGTAIDAVGLTAPAAGPSATFAVDNTAPTTSISDPSTPITRSGPVSFVVTYTDVNFKSSSLTAGNVSLNKTGTATGTVSVSNSGGSQVTVTISNIAGNGTLGISIPPGTAVDQVSHSAGAAGPSTTFTVTSAGADLNIAILGDGVFHLSVQGLSNTLYEIQYTDDLANPSWQFLNTVETDASGAGTYDDEVNASERFYRLVESPP